MSIFTYLSSLLPTFGKDRILEDLRMTRTEFQDFSLAYKEADKTLGKLKSKIGSDIGRVASNMGIGLKGGESIIGFIARNVQNFIDNIDLLERLVKQEMPDTVAAQGLDVKQLNYLQLAEVLSFTSRYSRFLVHYLAKKELEDIAILKKIEIFNEILPFEDELIEEGKIPFLTAIRQISRPVQEVQESLASIPEMIAKEANYKDLHTLVSLKKIEPFALSGQNFQWNPIYHIRMNLVESRELRYRECETQLTALNLQLQRVKLANAGKQDARLERDLKYLNSMISSVNKEMSDLT